jgi:hypothetical protein
MAKILVIFEYFACGFRENTTNVTWKIYYPALIRIRYKMLVLGLLLFDDIGCLSVTVNKIPGT